MPTESESMVRAAFSAMTRGDVEWLIERSHLDVELHMRGVAGEPVQ